MSKFLFFSPHAYIWLHAFPEAIIGEALIKKGHQLIYLTCGGVFRNHCIAMSAASLSQSASDRRKDSICRRCKINRNIIRQQFKFPGANLESYLNPEDYSRTQEILQTLTPQNFSELTLDGIEIGKLAVYEILLQFKKLKLEFSEEQWPHAQIALRNSLLAFFALKKLFAQERPNYLLVYNALYSVNAVACHIALKWGCIPYSLHAGPHLRNRISHIQIGKTSTYAGIKSLFFSQWERYREVPLKATDLETVTDHFIELLKGDDVFVYSAPKSSRPKSIREIFAIESSQKILVATLSSYDERFAAETSGAIAAGTNLLFPNQADWVQEIVTYVKSRPNLFLIIRVHPREMPNKREKVKSEHGAQLEVALQDLPKNVRVNWPSDNLSIYDLALETHLFLNAWSSVGKEMSLFGIPTLIYSSQLIFYPPDLNYLGEDRHTYFKQLEQALVDGWDFERVRRAFRCYSMEFNSATLDLSPSFKFRPINQKQFIRKAWARGKRTLLPGVFETLNCYNRANDFKDAETLPNLFLNESENLAACRSPVAGSLAQETAAIKSELKRLLKYLSPHDDASSKYDLIRNLHAAVSSHSES